jgi:hypothetical protein
VVPVAYLENQQTGHLFAVQSFHPDSDGIVLGVLQIHHV